MNQVKYLFIIIVILILFSCNKGKNSIPDKVENRSELNCNRPVNGGVICLDTFPVDSLNFIGSTVNSTSNIIYLLADALVTQDVNLKYVPQLAKKWEIKDDQEVVFYLRKDVEFHDGCKFTADDVIFTFHASLTADFPQADYPEIFSIVKKCEKLGDYRVKITYKKKTYDLLAPFVNFFILPKHLYDTKKYTLNNNPANDKPIGTGPFKFVKWDKNSQIVLEANKEYYNGSPYIDKLVFKVLEPGTMKFKMLMNNELDIISLSSVDWQYKTKSQDFMDNYYKLKYHTLGVYFIGWECKNSLFSDERVRQAMAYCVDLSRFNDKIQFGLYTPAATPLHLDVRYCARDLKPYSYSLKKASELLSKAGFFENKSGVLVDKNGNQFCFNIIISINNKSLMPFLEYMQENLSKIGVKMNILLNEEATYLSKLQKKDFDAYLGGIGTSDDPVFLNYIFGKTGMKIGINHMSYINKKIEKLFEKLKNEMDVTVRQKYFVEIQKIIYEEQPWLLLYYPASLVAVNNRIKGIEPSPLGIFQVYPGFKNVYIAKEKDN